MEEDSSGVLSGGSTRFEWGCGGVVPEVEAMIRACKPGGSGSCCLQLPLHVANLLVARRVDCRLEVSTDQKVRFVGVQMLGRQDMFIPTMSTQV